MLIPAFNTGKTQLAAARKYNNTTTTKEKNKRNKLIANGTLTSILGTTPHPAGGTYNALRLEISKFIVQPQFGEYYTKEIVYQDGTANRLQHLLIKQCRQHHQATTIQALCPTQSCQRMLSGQV